MNSTSAKWQDLDGLIDLILDDLHTPDDARRLNEILRADLNACRHYIAYAKLHGQLTWGDGFETGPNREIADSAISDPPLVIPSISPLPSLSTSHYPLTTDFVGGPVFSYMVASVVLCVMLLSAWAYKISHVGQVAIDNGKPSIRDYAQPRFDIVGQVTGMKDCRWSEDEPGTIIGAFVPIGRKYSLESGLMQITYTSGANVILEGPCEYIADSHAGGYLRVGKMVAKVEKKVASGQWPVARKKGRGVRGEGRGGLVASATSAKSPATNPQPPAPGPQPPLSTLHSPLFTISTPTAVVTDLGTEFGVEVDENGDTVSYVYSGSVCVRPFAEQGNAEVGSTILHENETVRVKHADEKNVPELAHPVPTDRTPKFVRWLHEPPKKLDLLDIVVGGDGTGNRRSSGIDPTTGVKVNVISIASFRAVDGKYHPRSRNSLVDGVFVPNGTTGSMQVSSTGVTFDGFPRTSGMAGGPIWARTSTDYLRKYDDAAIQKILTSSPNDLSWIQLIIRLNSLSPERLGLLCMPANVGITFDIESIRHKHHWDSNLTFTAITGLADVDPRIAKLANDSLADIWVIVDGQVKAKRIGFGRADDLAAVNVKIAPSERFLTLAVTDSGDGDECDWVVFGDPELKKSPTEPDYSQPSLRKKETRKKEKSRTE